MCFTTCVARLQPPVVPRLAESSLIFASLITVSRKWVPNLTMRTAGEMLSYLPRSSGAMFLSMIRPVSTISCRIFLKSLGRWCCAFSMLSSLMQLRSSLLRVELVGICG